MMAPTPAIGKDDLLQMLRDLETALGRAEVESVMARQDEETRRKFVAQRQEVTILKGQLENAQLADIADKLDHLAPELKAGIEQMQTALTTINNAIAIVNTVSTVLGLVARVAAFAK